MKENNLIFSKQVIDSKFRIIKMLSIQRKVLHNIFWVNRLMIFYQTRELLF